MSYSALKKYLPTELINKVMDYKDEIQKTEKQPYMGELNMFFYENQYDEKYGHFRDADRILNDVGLSEDDIVLMEHDPHYFPIMEQEWIIVFYN